MLAIIEDQTLVHGPLEFLITVDEETGMTGAFALSGDLLKGRIIINMDSEEEGTVYIGCAGGGDTKYKLPIKRTPVKGPRAESEESGYTAMTIQVSGLKGGHSGVNIHEGRANANKCLIRMINMGNKSISGGIRFVSLKGGSMRNAISREAHTTILIPEEKAEAFLAAAHQEIENLKLEFKPIDPGMTADFTETSLPDTAVDNESSARIIDILTIIPHGVLAMSLDIPELVETSTNLAIMTLEEDYLYLNMSTRSSIKSALEWGRSMHSAIGSLAGAEVDNAESYPGWKPDLDSSILKIVADVHEDLFGTVPEKKAIHAGLECGLIKEKFPGMDAVSIGPQIEHPHSPTERVNVPSVEKFYRYISAILTRVTES